MDRYRCNTDWDEKAPFVGGIIFLVLTLGYYATSNIPLLFIIRVIQGMGFGIGATASGTIAGHIVPASRRGEGIGYYALCQSRSLQLWDLL